MKDNFVTIPLIQPDEKLNDFMDKSTFMFSNDSMISLIVGIVLSIIIMIIISNASNYIKARFSHKGAMEIPMNIISSILIALVVVLMTVPLGKSAIEHYKLKDTAAVNPGEVISIFRDKGFDLAEKPEDRISIDTSDDASDDKPKYTIINKENNEKCSAKLYYLKYSEEYDHATDAVFEIYCPHGVDPSQ